MLRFSDASTEAFVNSMDQISQRMAKAQKQLSTGFRVASISDQPDSVSTILQARADSGSNNQIVSNLGLVKTETDAGEQALESAVSLGERALLLGSQGLALAATTDS